MLYALDTEFIDDGRTIELISLGLIGEDGRTYYKQVVNVETAWSNTFVLHNVLPHLTPCPSDLSKSQHWSHWSSTKAAGCVDGCPWQWREHLGQEIVAFCGESPQFITYYGAYDWVVLCQLFGSMMALPSGWPMYAHDLRSLLDLYGYAHITQPDDSPHHALSDARWIMETWQRYHTGV